MEISEQILKTLKSNFQDKNLATVETRIRELYNSKLNVGHDQLIKSILFLSQGSIEKFNSFFPIDDPRDIILEAQIASGNNNIF